MMINLFWNVVTSLNTFPHGDNIFPNDFKCKGAASGPQWMLLPLIDNGPGRKAIVMNLLILPIWSRIFHRCWVFQFPMTSRENDWWNDACPGLLYSWLLCFTCSSYLYCLLYCSYIDYTTSQIWVEWSAAISWLF